MKFILAYPETTGPEGDLLDSGPVGEIALAAERAGFDGFALTEHPIPGARWLSAGGHQTLDPFIGLSFAAAATTRIRLLTYLTVIPYRNPLLLAKTAASLDRLSGGRLILGVGTGYQKSEFRALGVDLDERNTLFDEALEVLPLAWSGQPFSYTGKHFDARDVIAKPRPAQDPIPIWIGGNAAITRRRVAERCQGWMPLGGTAELSKTTRTPFIESNTELADQIATMRDAAGARGPSLEVVSGYGVHGSDYWNETERHREAFAELAAAGVTGVVISSPAGAPPRATDFVAMFGKTYIT